MDLKGKHVFVTGAAKRIGRALSEAFLQSGVRLSAHYHHSKEKAVELVGMANSLGVQAKIFSADLGQISEIECAISNAVGQFGPIDLLVNSASIFEPAATLCCTTSQWDNMLNINLRGQFFFAREAIKTMSDRQGLIINIADVHASKPIRNYTPYASAKAGLVMMTRNLAKEWAPNIRVNSISPGPVLLPESYNEAQRVKSSDRTLFKRIGSARDIVNAALFIIGNDYITGFDLKVDGGRSLV